VARFKAVKRVANTGIDDRTSMTGPVLAVLAAGTWLLWPATSPAAVGPDAPLSVNAREGNPPGVMHVTRFGAVGDGVTDDTTELQRALTACSQQGLTCSVPKGRRFLVTSPLYFWGNARLVGEDGSGALVFKVRDAPYLFNLGISAPRKLESPFSGVISRVRFETTGGSGGRIIFLWRTRDAEISDNHFDVGTFAYSATSSGNDDSWVQNGFQNCVRRNIRIIRNTIVALATDQGSEGIGLGHFDGAVIEGNEIKGVGDDPVGIHFSNDVRILNNDVSSTDGRIFVSNSSRVEVAHNTIRRAASLQDGRFYPGISLLYVGFESYRSTTFQAPTATDIHDNQLYYPAQSVDAGAAIYLYAPRQATVDGNRIVNDSSRVTATALHLLPAAFDEGWRDPARRDPQNVARVWDVTITNNRSEGAYPLGFNMSGNCVDYQGPVRVRGNVGPAFNFYCDRVVATDNRTVRE
jgi:hypothetical protein